MNRKKTTKTRNLQNVKREGDPIPWRYCLLTLVCGLILVGGFFFAARQHFFSIDYGIKNSQLKKQKDELETAQRQLLIDKEFALSPAAIKKVAKEYGFTEVAASVESFYTNEKEAVQKPKAEKVSETKTIEKKSDVKTRKEEKKSENKTIVKADSKSKKGV